MTAEANPARRLFEIYGIEVEYMLVNRDTLDVMPIAGRVLKKLAGGAWVNEHQVGGSAWSNELALHVLELKVHEPVKTLRGLGDCFAGDVKRMNKLLDGLGGCLMPSGMHPWMNPVREFYLWPHEGREIYSAFDRIFNCRAHGWANLQSMHINLPYANDEEFARLHAAIRLLLPVMPALAASSPFLDGRITGRMDNRLDAYRTNAEIVPMVSGPVIPEAIFCPGEYREKILQQIYRDMVAHDPKGILAHEWINARGAIPHFERNAIEIRVLDSQECPRADLAVAWAVVNALSAIVDEWWCSLKEQKEWGVEPLRKIFLDTIRDADQAVIADPAYLRALGYDRPGACRARDLWDYLIEQTVPDDPVYTPALETILVKGCLARRLIRASEGNSDRPSLERICRGLCSSLNENRLFLP